jgi:hypothetical protein
MAHNVISYNSPAAARRASQAINSITQNGGFSGQVPSERRRPYTSSVQTDGSSYEYNGYFKIVDASTTDENGVTSFKIKVVDGMNQSEGYCGLVQFEGQTFNVANYESPVITDVRGSIYIACSIDRVFVSVGPVLPNPDINFIYREIGYYYYSNRDNTYHIVQEHISGVFVVSSTEYRGPFSIYLDRVYGKVTIKGGNIIAGNRTYTVDNFEYTGSLDSTVFFAIITKTEDGFVPSISADESNAVWSERLGYVSGSVFGQVWKFGDIRIIDRWV